MKTNKKKDMNISSNATTTEDEKGGKKNYNN